MPDVLEARRPLGTPAQEPLRSHGCATTVRVAERPLDAAFAVRFDACDADAIAAVAARTGLHLHAASRSVSANGGIALWLGPGDWLVKPAPRSPALAARERPTTDPRYTIVDVSDLWSIVRLQGARTRDVLAKGCALDLAPARFACGAAAVTQLARIRALIHYADADAGYDVHVERSYAAYLWAWLTDAMREFLHS